MDFSITLGKITQRWTIDDADASDVIAALRASRFHGQGALSDDDAVALWQQRVFKDLLTNVRSHRLSVQAQALQSSVKMPTSAEVSVIAVAMDEIGSTRVEPQRGILGASSQEKTS